VTASFNPSSTTSNSILTLTAASTAATGIATLTIASATASATNTATVNLTVLAPAPGATSVSLSSVFNTKGIYKDGTKFSSGGLDTAGDALSANLLGSGLSFDGCVFNLGPTAGLDAVACKGQRVTLPAGQYSCLNMLAVSVAGNQVDQTFVVNYTDGTSATFIQSLSDWAAMQSNPGETLVSFMAYSDNGNGAPNTTSSASIYGYSFALNPNKIVNTIKLPNNAYVMVLAMSLSRSEAPSIDGQPQSLAVAKDEPASFSVVAAGAPNLSYYWQWNGTNLADSSGEISGSSTSSLTLSETTTNDTGSYVVVISNSYGSVTSIVATLSVLSPPVIFSQPVPLTLACGSPASFSVGAGGTAPLAYQWQINGSNLMDGGEISGSETNMLTLSAITTNDAGSYVVVITNMWGSVTSAVAALTVTLPSPLLLPATEMESGLITLNWTTVPGQLYQVRFTGDLSAGLWTNLGPPIMATNASMTGSDTIGPDPQRFYQVLLVQ
jgi:hypothetical protein